MNKKAIWLLVLLVFIGFVVWLIRTPGKPGVLDGFATCVKDSGAKYYAAFWCPNCKNQQALFGRSAALLPRIECSTPDSKGQLQVCIDAEVKGYPTWDFADGTRVTGVQTLEQLASSTGCVLPAEQ